MGFFVQELDGAGDDLVGSAQLKGAAPYQRAQQIDAPQGAFTRCQGIER